jgi:hypothetical protein
VVVALQAALPNARVVYASATGASEPANMGYMSRLGNFGFNNQLDLLRTVDNAGTISTTRAAGTLEFDPSIRVSQLH